MASGNIKPGICYKDVTIWLKGLTWKTSEAYENGAYYCESVDPNLPTGSEIMAVTMTGWRYWTRDFWIIPYISLGKIGLTCNINNFSNAAELYIRVAYLMGGVINPYFLSERRCAA